MQNHQERSLAGKVALVTGSTLGIGAGIARTFAAHGAAVVIHGLEREQGESVVAALEAMGRESIYIPGDLRNESECRNLVRQTVHRFGQLDVLVNNAGIYPRGNLETTTVELWDRIFAINLRAPFILCQEAVKYMKERHEGCIINIGSMNCYVGLPKVFAYSAAKGGLTTMTRNLANQLKQYGIRVNQVNPGWALTEGEQHVQAVVEGRGPNWVEEAEKKLPFGHLQTPEDIGRAVWFIATSDNITGSVLDYSQFLVGAPVEV
ncbi:MAG TPA: oxidoreductase [Terriglobia bacterium]|jgi:NAD(P)-dependent dehydrogenase (short-subunit alcohol dehydrogenase family)|nr:oxidoreductase [Terriglobia bacterium]